MKKGLNPEWLKGLVFRTSERKEMEKEGRKVPQYIPVERPLTEKEVMAWKEGDTSVTIVTADGRKYTVKKEKSKGV